MGGNKLLICIVWRNVNINCKNGKRGDTGVGRKYDAVAENSRHRHRGLQLVYPSGALSIAAEGIAGVTALVADLKGAWKR